MNTLLFVAHDPGGANVLEPIIQAFGSLNRANNTLETKRKDWQRLMLLLGPAAERINAHVEPHDRVCRLPTHPTPNFPNEQSVAAADMGKLFDAHHDERRDEHHDKHRIDAVITATSFNSNVERLAIRLATARGIPTFAMLDYWSHYTQRFTLDGETVYPSVILVTDKRMQAECCAETGLDEARVRVVGNPHLERVAVKHRQTMSSHNSGHTNSVQTIRFFTENIRHYYPHKTMHEFVMVEHLATCLTALQFTGTLVVRPHPMESREPWMSALAAWQAQQRFSCNVVLDTASFADVLHNAEGKSVAVGLTSMALLETAVCGIPTFSYQINVPQNDGYFFLPFEEYGIHKIQSDNDVALLLAPTPSPIVTGQQSSVQAIIRLVEEHLESKHLESNRISTTPIR